MQVFFSSAGRVRDPPNRNPNRTPSIIDSMVNKRWVVRDTGPIILFLKQSRSTENTHSYILPLKVLFSWRHVKKEQPTHTKNIFVYC